MFGLPGQFPLKKCRKCSLVFINNKMKQSELKRYYPSKKYYSYNMAVSKGFFSTLREYLMKHYYSPSILSTIISFAVHNVPAIPKKVKNGKILDIGCGSGETLFLLKKLGWNVYGLDIDKEAIKNAQKNKLLSVQFGTYKNLKIYPDNFFDAIRLYHVIEHINDPVLCLQLIFKKIKVNGELLIGTPNTQSFMANIFKSYWYNLDTPRHLFLFSPQNLRVILEKNGFKVIKTEFCSAGGLVGSMQYVAEAVFNRKIDLIHKQWLVMLFYPLERILDVLRCGDVFVVRAKKSI